MEIKKIVDYVNRAYISSDYIREPEIYYYMDLVIDDINERLQAKFPTITDWGEFCAEWNSHLGPSVEPPGPPEGVPHPIEPVPVPPPVPPRPRPVPISPYVPMLNHPPKPHHIKPRNNRVYDAFPDEYIRTVLALGTALKFFERDEEGEQIALNYQMKYEQALFKMQRDYIDRVPWYFQDNTGGYIDFTYEEEMGPWNLRPRGVVMRDVNTKNL